MYNITKGQYITILVFGVLVWLSTIWGLLDGNTERGDVRVISPVYETVKMLDKEGKKGEAQEIVEELTDEHYGFYRYLKHKKNMKKSDKMRLSISEQIRMMPTVAGTLFLLTPSILIFYTIGWLNYSRSKIVSQNSTK